MSTWFDLILLVVLVIGCLFTFIPAKYFKSINNVMIGLVLCGFSLSFIVSKGLSDVIKNVIDLIKGWI